MVTGSQVKLPRRGISAAEDALVMHARVITGAGGGPEKTIVNSPRFLVDEGYPMVCAYMRDPNDPYFPELLERAGSEARNNLASRRQRSFRLESHQSIQSAYRRSQTRYLARP